MIETLGQDSLTRTIRASPRLSSTQAASSFPIRSARSKNPAKPWQFATVAKLPELMNRLCPADGCLFDLGVLRCVKRTFASADCEANTSCLHQACFVSKRLQPQHHAWTTNRTHNPGANTFSGTPVWGPAVGQHATSKHCKAFAPPRRGCLPGLETAGGFDADCCPQIGYPLSGWSV